MDLFDTSLAPKIPHYMVMEPTTSFKAKQVHSQDNIFFESNDDIEAALATIS